MKNRSEKWGAPIVEAPEEARRDNFVPAEQDHHNLRPEGDQAIQGRTTNCDRRPQSSQSAHSESLWTRIREAVRPRPPTTPDCAGHNDVRDYGVNKNVENMPQLRQRMSEIIDHYDDAQQDILEMFVDRSQLRKLTEPTMLANGKRIPGLKLDPPRQLAVMHALVRFANIAAGSTFTRPTCTPQLWRLSASSHPITRWRHSVTIFPNCRQGLGGKDSSLVPLPSNRARLFRLPDLLKLFERIYDPLMAGLLKPFAGDHKLARDKRSELDRLYQRILNDLTALLHAIGLKTAA